MRRQCRRFEFQRILLPVRMRIHWGMGRFWAIFFASVRFVRKVLCDGCGGGGRVYVHTSTSPLGPYTLQSGSIDFGTGNLTTQGQQTTVTSVAYVSLQLDLLSTKRDSSPLCVVTAAIDRFL